MRMQPGIASLRPVPPAPRDASPALDAGAWFEAPTPFGPLRLCAFTGTPVRHAADAALALFRCEALLDPLQTWSALPLDWRWLAAPGQRLSAATHGCARWQRRSDGSAGSAEAMCLVSAPWPLLRSMAPPPVELAAILRWQLLPVVLSASHFRLEEDELALVEPGGAIVLPDSLQAPWRGRLRGAAETPLAGLGASVTLDSPTAARLVRGHAGGVAGSSEGRDPRVACEVRLAMPHPLPGDRLTGWLDEEALLVAGAQASLWCSPDPREPALCLAEGRLMPWGDGWALAVETLRRFGGRAAS